MADPKTRKNDASVHDFIASVDDPQKRNDSMALLKIFKEVLGEEPVMWGPSIVGFGSYHYVYKSGREGDWFLTGFSPRRQALTIYVMGGFEGHDALLEKLGRVKVSQGSCIYVKRLADLDMQVLENLVTASVKQLQKKDRVSA
jgi:hypothetical protein